MIKKITLFVAAALIVVSASAQIKVNVGGGLMLPTGDFGDVAKMGFGGNIGGKYMLNEKMAIGASVGYYTMSASDDMIDMYKLLSGSTDVKLNFTIIPIVGNFSYYFMTEGFKPYAGLDLGFYMAKGKLEIEGEDFSKEAGLDGETKLGLAPVLGFEYAFSEKLSLDVNAKYNYIMTEGDATTAVGINIGVAYSF